MAGEFRFGIEEEYFLVDAETKAIAPTVPKALSAAVKTSTRGRGKGEFLQQQLEVATEPHIEMAKASAELRRLRHMLAGIMAPLPPSNWLWKSTMRVPQVNHGWNPIESAPFDEDVTLQVTDGRGEPYTINWPCRRTAAGWINSRKRVPLEVTPVKWRPYSGPRR